MVSDSNGKITIPVTPKPYNRKGLVIYVWGENNSTDFRDSPIAIAPNSNSCLLYLVKYDGTMYQSIITVNFITIIFSLRNS